MHLKTFVYMYFSFNQIKNNTLLQQMWSYKHTESVATQKNAITILQNT